MKTNFNTIENAFKPTDDGKCSISTGGMVSSQSAEASFAGAAMLKAGGNAVDAAIATALALGVTEPQASGLGGQTMMLIGNKTRTIAVDGSSRAPSLAHVSAIYKRDRSLSYRASTVPSTPAVLWYIHNRYGLLPWKKIIEPAIRFAEEGYRITALQHNLLVREAEKFKKVQSQSGLHYFFKNSEAYQPGDVFIQKHLAALLKKLADKGVEEFYKGKTAKIIDADMRENGGLLRYDDLALIPWPIERKPLKKKFNGLYVFSMPPPGSGRSLLFALLMLDLIPGKLRKMELNKKNLLLVKILRQVFIDRSDRPFDPNFYPQIEEEKIMLSSRYARKCLKSIMQEVDGSILPSIPTDDELKGETTHLSVIDRNGLAVSLTQSIERVYGSKAAARELGFLYNNYLFDFDYELPEHPFYLRPNAVPWATVAPTLIFHENDIWMALGSPGSERIISALVTFLLHITDEYLPVSEAMKAPRIHCSLGGRVSLEAGRFHPGLIQLLADKGYRIDKREDFSFYLGCIQAVLKKHDHSGFQGVADVRRDGAAVGF